MHSKFDERDEDNTFVDKATVRNTLDEILRAEEEVSQATLEYGYDAVGNRTYERFTKATVHAKTYTYYANSNRLLSDGKYAFVYDADGNLIRKGNRFTIQGEDIAFTTSGRGVEYWEYGYNLRNQLTQVHKNGQLVATYAYDGLGLRVTATTTISSRATGESKTTTRDYVFDLADRVIYDQVISTSGQLPPNKDPETSSTNSYVFANGTHFAKVEGAIGSGAEVYFYHNDHLGSPMAITDSQGNLAWSQDYLPFGEALNESAMATKTRFTFTGKELDPATGLYYYNARWYDADLGRFVTEDTYKGDPNSPQTLNRFVYVVGNPLKYVDPTGHDVGTPGKDASEMAKTEAGREELRERQEYMRDPEAAFERMRERMHGSAKETPDIIIGTVAVGVVVKLAAPVVVPAIKSGAAKVATGIGVAWTQAGDAVKKFFSDLGRSAVQARETLGDMLQRVSLGRGSTGRIIPNSLNEQLAMKQVLSNPLEDAVKVPVKMNDPRWLAQEGWEKMQRIIETSSGKIKIHFNVNEAAGLFDDFKFVK